MRFFSKSLQFTVKSVRYTQLPGREKPDTGESTETELLTIFSQIPSKQIKSDFLQG